MKDLPKTYIIMIACRDPFTGELAYEPHRTSKDLKKVQDFVDDNRQMDGNARMYYYTYVDDLE